MRIIKQNKNKCGPPLNSVYLEAQQVSREQAAPSGDLRSIASRPSLGSNISNKDEMDPTRAQ